MSGAAADPAEARQRDDTARQREGAVALWAIAGALWLAFVLQALVRWVSSPTEFGAAPVLGPDVMGHGKLVALRVIEGASVLIAVGTYWHFLIKPWRAHRRLRLDGMIVLGSTAALFIDPLINYFHYTFGWNNNAINLGSWLASFPMHQGPTRYGEGYLWFAPQYLYLGIGLASIEGAGVRWLRGRFPGISNVRALSAMFLFTLCLDLVLENVFVRLEVYGFPRTWSWLTLFPGSQYQFPIYESIFVGLYATGFAVLRLAAADSPDGTTFLHRGIYRFRPALRTPVRLLAVTGFCAALAFFAYFAPWSWMSVNADSLVQLPSYMRPG